MNMYNERVGDITDVIYSKCIGYFMYLNLFKRTDILNFQSIFLII